MCILLLPFCNPYFTIVIFSSEQEVNFMNQVQDQSWTARLPIAELDQTGAIRWPKRPQPEPKKAEAAPAADTHGWREEFRLYLEGTREWTRIHLRRWAHLFHGAAAGTMAVGPVSFLLVAGALGAALTLTTLYSTSYTVTVDGQKLGVVADQSVVENAIRTVEEQGSRLLGYDYRVDGEISYDFAITLKSDLSRERDISDYFYGQLNEVSDQLRAYQITLNGQAVGAVKDEAALNSLLDSIKAQFVTDATTSAEFVEDVSITPVYAAENLMNLDQIEAALKANTTGETTYTVVKGDTYNGIAYRNDMSLSDLMALNPQASLSRLMVGDVLNVKEVIPALSVRTCEHVTYTEAIACPVEEVEDSSMYKGDSKILTQGQEGEAQVQADVIYVNGYERERTVTDTTTLREPTTTVKAVGTKERPKTASKGTYLWPVSSHRINSYFGGRKIFGRYSYHSGLDIHASYGEAVHAADGGTVTFAGYKGSYGNLVIITHDNGTQTYYAHNSSLVVSAGQKVYQGQTIAKAGSTGRSTGVHCHFEVRVRGTAVNPLNYLR